MPAEIQHSENTRSEMKTHHQIIRVAILAEEPLGWGSGKHFFPVILENYTWNIQGKTYTFKTEYLYDRDIIKGRLNTSEFDILLVPGGGVGDGQAVMKGFVFLRKVRRWKRKILAFIQQGGGYVGICGGTALLTDLKIDGKKPRSFLERQYHKSSLGVSCISSYYKSIAFPLFYPFQKTHPEKIGAIAYVFSFAPGETSDGKRIHSGGVPLEFQLSRNHPIFSDFPKDTERIRWWGGPALIVPEKPDRDVAVLARYPTYDISDQKSIQIHAWNYQGGLHRLISAFLKASKYIKSHHDSLKNVFLYTYYMAEGWKRTNQVIQLDFTNKPSITAEVYPNKNQGRILLCTSHPEYMVWWNGYIREMDTTKPICLGTGLYQWKDIAPFSPNAEREVTHTWWLVRRFVAWAAKIPDDCFPPIQIGESIKKENLSILKNVFWDGSLKNQMENI